ncbi:MULTISPECIES: ABC transporter ATP-binding protein [unclassified Rhizobium]|uniref:dipeptide ABC transporter ATP-binding protein n=1 Tax=unclassified Rhizobium TaxID=2613769 RepID=UPI001608C288|nr:MULTISPECIES: ABC transporter ATP-binding protein [unclassified Rhizobium]MBB3319256.1 peptide/nickel transport system ATP-binding protein [Rhizobium sp. BK181]MCS4094920.1 peptide/nickel transport system ATP-binding protein [Rhizobium sp. BK176]
MKTGSIEASGGGPLLKVEGLAISFGRAAITTSVSIALERGESIAIVGESGSGKSVTARAIAGLLPPGLNATGAITFDGMSVMPLPERERRKLRGYRVSMLMQDPFTMLNPLMRCGDHIDEMLRDRPEFASRQARGGEVQRRLEEVGISDPDVARRLPFELSGGMCQRVAMAAALARDPDLLIADEATTALDVTSQADIMKLLGHIQRERHMGLILVTHNLRLAFATCQRVYVLYAGSVLEVGDAISVERRPFHPYTLGLLLSEPPVDIRVQNLVAMRGSVPRAADVIDRCGFADRCDWASEVCRASKPPLGALSALRSTACLRQDEIQSEIDARRATALSEEPKALSRGETTDCLVRVDSLSKTFSGARGRPVRAVREVSLHIRSGECVGLVGESGSGKTTIGRCLVGLENPTSGNIVIDGISAGDYRALTKGDLARIRRTIQMVFQDAYSTLNPRHSVGQALAEALGASVGATDPVTPERIVSLLAEVGLSASYTSRRSRSLSGGERQRVAIARALAVEPAILVCDEPVSALDVSVQGQVLNLFRRLQVEHALSYLFITHDLAVLRQIAERIYVLYLGEIVEEGPTEKVIGDPQHPYTRRLVKSIPRGTIKLTR